MLWSGELARKVESAYGSKYVVDGSVPCVGGSELDIRTVQIVEQNAEAPRFVTVYSRECSPGSIAMIQEHDTVVVNRDLKDVGLVAGDIGAVVHVYEGSHMAEVELVTGEGATIAVETLSFTDIRPIGRGEILHARSLETA